MNEQPTEFANNKECAKSSLIGVCYATWTETTKLLKLKVLSQLNAGSQTVYIKAGTGITLPGDAVAEDQPTLTIRFENNNEAWHSEGDSLEVPITESPAVSFSRETKATSLSFNPVAYGNGGEMGRREPPSWPLRAQRVGCARHSRVVHERASPHLEWPRTRALR